jgi:hypothetical protein
MTDRGSCTRVRLDGRRVVVDLSDADLERLTAIAARRDVDGPQLVLGWIRRGMLSNRIWAQPSDRPDRVDRDVDVAQQSDALFRDLLGDIDHPD